MFKKLKLLHGGISTVADLEVSLAEFDIATLEASLATAQQRRTDLLLTGSDAEILAAEDAATKARLTLDRAMVAVTELPRRLEEAREAEAHAAALKSRDDAVTDVDKAVARIRSDYVRHAQAISDLVAEANAADTAAELFNNEVYATGEYEDIGPVKLVHDGLGWSKKFDIPPKFGKSISLPEVDDFSSIGVHSRWLTKLEKFALFSIGNPDDFLEASGI